MDEADRLADLKEDNGLGFCNITKCCTEVCPVDIQITNNSIIPLKERVADEFYDPVMWAWRKLRGRNDAPKYDPLPMLPNPALNGPSGDPTAPAPMSAEPMGGGIKEPEEQAGGLPAEPAGSASTVGAAASRSDQAARSGAAQAPQPPDRRSDAGDETSSEN
jgi:hypothetical protein